MSDVIEHLTAPGLSFYAKPLPLALPWADDVIALVDASGLGNYQAGVDGTAYAIFRKFGTDPVQSDGAKGPEAVWEKGAAAGSIDSQALRDAMKLAPSAGAAAAGSVDDELDHVQQTSGTTKFTLIIQDADGTPVPGVSVRVSSDQAGEYVIEGPRFTNAAGEAVFYSLVNGDPYYRWAELAGETFANPQPFTAVAD